MVCPSLVVVSGFIIGNMRLPNHWSLVLHFWANPGASGGAASDAFF